MAQRLVHSLRWGLAGLLAVCLPFTSFPLVARLIGSSMVAPLSLLPLLALLAVWLIPYLWRSGSIPLHAAPLFGFFLTSLVSAAGAFFLPFPPYKSASLLRSETEALATLVIGICFYLFAAVWPRQLRQLHFLLRWINWSGALALGWALFQAVVWQWQRSYPDWMWKFQESVSTSLLLYVDRVNGFAYEPSWLAHLLNMLYLPMWLSSAVHGYTAHRLRIGKLHLEHLLLAGGLAALVLSVSRIGLLTFLVMAAYLILLLSRRLLRWLQERLVRACPPGDRRVKMIQTWFPLAGALALLLVYSGLLLGAAYGLSRFDARMQKLFDFSTLREQSFFHYANQLVFAERIVFWQAGWEIFNDHPLLGVGLGNSGYFFPQKLSAFSWSLAEIRTLAYQWTSLPNIKSLWVRLLAETGLAGFAFFACFWYLLWQSAAFLRRRYAGGQPKLAAGERLIGVVGLSGTFVLIGFLIEGFSLDTFALPYYWISFGLLTAACRLGMQAGAGTGSVLVGGVEEKE